MSKRALRFSATTDMPAGMRQLAERQMAGPAAATPAKPMARARFAKHAPGEMNRTEAEYAQFLDAMKLRGEVQWWDFEPFKQRLAKATTLTMDFWVVLADGSIELVDVKGRKGDTYWAEEDAKVKIKVAAEKFPCAQYVIVWPAKVGGWCREVVG